MGELLSLNDIVQQSNGRSPRQCDYWLRRLNIRPVMRVGNVRLYDPSASERVLQYLYRRPLRKEVPIA